MLFRFTLSFHNFILTITNCIVHWSVEYWSVWKMISCLNTPANHSGFMWMGMVVDWFWIISTMSLICCLFIETAWCDAYGMRNCSVDGCRNAASKFEINTIESSQDHVSSGDYSLIDVAVLESVTSSNQWPVTINDSI